MVSSAILILALPFWGGSFSWRAVQWGAAGGVAGMAGAALLYRGLAIGRMGVVAPITAVLAAAIPLSFALAIGERPGSVALIGVVVGLVAVVLISSSPEPDSTDASVEAPPSTSMQSGGRGVVEALGAGAGFGLFFILLERAPGDSGLWPLSGRGSPWLRSSHCWLRLQAHRSDPLREWVAALSGSGSSIWQQISSFFSLLGPAFSLSWPS